MNGMATKIDTVHSATTSHRTREVRCIVIPRATQTPVGLWQHHGQLEVIAGPT